MGWPEHVLSACALGCLVLGQVPIQGCSAHPEVLRDVLGRVPIDLHLLRGGDVISVVNLAGATELGAVGP